MKPTEKITLCYEDIELLKFLISYMLDKKANQKDISKLIDLYVELVRNDEPPKKKGGK